MKIGFIGLGLMGLPMAKNILKAKFPLTVYNRTTPKTKELESLGAKIAKTPSELAGESDLVITMVTGPSQVEEVLFGSNGVVKGAKKGLIIVDMSTIGPTSAREINAKLIKKGIQFLDAPVTGSIPKAITGELTIFIGGKESIYKKAKPVLNSLGTTLHLMGGSGAGQAIKLVNNLVVALSMEALAEGMVLATTERLSKAKVAQVLENTPALSPFQKLKLEPMVKGTYPTLFSVSNMEKDLKLACSELKLKKLPVLTKVRALYEQAKIKGLGDQDISAILEVLK